MSNKRDYIPRTNAAFNVWQRNLRTYVSSRKMDWTVPDSAFTEWSSYSENWEATFSTASNPATRTAASVMAKNEALKLYVASIRKDVMAYIANNPSVTDADRENMALNVHDRKPSPIPAPTERPNLQADFSNKQQHVIFVKSLLSHGKPENAHGFELYKKVGEPAPARDDDYLYAGFSTKSPFTIRFNLEDTGKIVYYRGRWVNAKNEPGPWSEVIFAVIA